MEYVCYVDFKINTNSTGHLIILYLIILHALSTVFLHRSTKVLRKHCWSGKNKPCVHTTDGVESIKIMCDMLNIFGNSLLFANCVEGFPQPDGLKTIQNISPFIFPPIAVFLSDRRAAIVMSCQTSKQGSRWQQAVIALK